MAAVTAVFGLCHLGCSRRNLFEPMGHLMKAFSFVKQAVKGTVVSVEADNGADRRAQNIDLLIKITAEDSVFFDFGQVSRAVLSDQGSRETVLLTGDIDQVGVRQYGSHALNGIMFAVLFASSFSLQDPLSCLVHQGFYFKTSWL